MGSRPRIAVDAMGGDGGPTVTVAASLELAHRVDLILVGDAERLRAELGDLPPSVTLHHAADVLSPGDSLADVLRRRPDSSMRQALLRHAAGEADAVVSAGDTAALMALSRATLEMIPGVERPAICKSLQGMAGPFWLLDLGANLDCTAAQLGEFAHMGSALARQVSGIAEPRVALLNIGTEAGKGPAVLREAARLLETDGELRFVGFIEGNVLFSDAADVVVTNGFAGNIALKSIEGAARMAGHLLSRWLEETDPARAAREDAVATAEAQKSTARVESLRHALNPQRYNGASFVGLAGVVVKSHGSADVEGFRSAIEEAVLEVEGRLPMHVAAEFA